MIVSNSQISWNILHNNLELEVFHIDQLSSVSVHLWLNLISYAVGEYGSSALPNTTSILFICTQITTLAIHHLCYLHTEM